MYDEVVVRGYVLKLFCYYDKVLCEKSEDWYVLMKEFCQVKECDEENMIFCCLKDCEVVIKVCMCMFNMRENQ